MDVASKYIVHFTALNGFLLSAVINVTLWKRMWWTTNKHIYMIRLCCVMDPWLDSKWLKSTCTTACCVSWGSKRTFGEIQNVHKYNTVIFAYISVYWERMYSEQCWLMLKRSTDSYTDYWLYRTQLPPTRGTRWQFYCCFRATFHLVCVNGHAPNYSRGGVMGTTWKDAQIHPEPL